MSAFLPLPGGHRVAKSWPPRRDELVLALIAVVQSVAPLRLDSLMAGQGLHPFVFDSSTTRHFPFVQNELGGQVLQVEPSGL